MYNFPYTNFHELNQDWILKKIQSMEYETGVFRDVKYYGAVGDGLTDDSEAISECIENEDIIIFPIGTYYISESITKALSNKIILGWPHATIIEDNANISFINSENIKVFNLTFDYINTRPNSNITFWRCLDIEIAYCDFVSAENFNIQCSTCGRTYIHDNYLKETSSHAGISLSIDNGYENSDYGTSGWTIIRDCTILNSGLDGIIANNYNVIIDRCIIKNCGTKTPAAGVYSNNKTNLTITNCRISANSGNGIDIVSGYQIIIIACFCSGNNSAGIFLGSCGNVSIDSCHCNNNGLDPIDAWQSSGIVVKEYNGNNSHNVRVAKCFAQSNSAYGFRFLNCDGVYIDALFAINNSSGQTYIEGTATVYESEYAQIT